MVNRLYSKIKSFLKNERKNVMHSTPTLNSTSLRTSALAQEYRHTLGNSETALGTYFSSLLRGHARVHTYTHILRRRATPAQCLYPSCTHTAPHPPWLRQSSDPLSFPPGHQASLSPHPSPEFHPGQRPGELDLKTQIAVLVISVCTA